MKTKLFSNVVTALLIVLCGSNVFCQSWNKTNPNILYATDKHGSISSVKVGIGTTEPKSPLDVKGQIIADSLHIAKSIRLGLHSFNWVADVSIGGGVLSDQMRSTNGNITIGNDVAPYSNILVGIGLTNPAFKLDVVDDINVRTTLPNQGYWINNNVVLQNPGVDNIFVGVDAGVSNFSGLTAGTQNSFFGSMAGTLNTIGSRNTFIGNHAGSSNLGGGENTAIGNFALSNNVNGGNNTALGSAALRSNNDGIDNTAVGRDALTNNISGDYNTSVGAYSLWSANSGSYNTANGVFTLSNNSCNNNTATGYIALSVNLSGSNNTAYGSGALVYNSNNFNTAIGS